MGRWVDLLHVLDGVDELRPGVLCDNRPGWHCQHAGIGTAMRQGHGGRCSTQGRGHTGSSS